MSHSSGDKLFNELAFHARLPVVISSVDAWPPAEILAFHDERNQRLLAGLLVLDRQIGQADDPADAARDLHRLENKLDLLLLMLSEQLQTMRPLPEASSLLISSAGFASTAPLCERPPPTCRLQLYPSSSMALAIEWWARLETCDTGQVAWRFHPMSDALHDALVRWVFRHHRRTLASRATEAGVSAASQQGAPS